VLGLRSAHAVYTVGPVTLEMRCTGNLLGTHYIQSLSQRNPSKLRQANKCPWNNAPSSVLALRRSTHTRASLQIGYAAVSLGREPCQLQLGRSGAWVVKEQSAHAAGQVTRILASNPPSRIAKSVSSAPRVHWRESESRCYEVEHWGRYSRSDLDCV
jgi:hypothetical protein